MNVFETKANYETVNIVEAKEEISQAVKLYGFQDETGNKTVATRRARPLCLMGPAGIGKTEIVAQVAKEQGLGFCNYSLVHHTRQSLLGLPRLQEENWAGETVCCTYYTMSEIIAEIHKIIENTGLKRGILFLDEFNCASESIRPVMLQLLQEKALGTHKIPEGWVLVLSGNPTQYNKSAKELDPVTLDRVRLLHVEPDLNVWLEYGRQNGIHPVILSFLEENPLCFSRYEGKLKNQELVTPRGWEDLSIQMKLMEKIEAPITPAFIGQFFQSTEVIHSFFSYYCRFGPMNGNGLMERILEGNSNSIGEIKELNVQNRWAVITSVIKRIESLAMQVTKKEDTVAYIHNILKEHPPELKGSATKAIDFLHNQADELSIAPNTQEALLLCANSIQSENHVWGTIKDFFQTKLVEPSKKERSKAITQIENMLSICNEAITDAENAERILYSLADNQNTATFIASADIPAFQTLCQNTQFEASDVLKNQKNKINEAS